MVLSGHLNTLYTKLVHLDTQIQIHCIYPHSQLDAIQLNVLDYDPDTDREPNSVTAKQPSNAESVKENTFTGTSKSEDHTTICPTTNRSEHQPSEVPSDIQSNKHDNIKQQQAEHPSDYHPQLEDIPEVETDKETGTMVSLMMQSFSIIPILLRKVREYIMSTLLTLKK